MPRKLFLAPQEISLSLPRSLFCSLSTRYRVLLIFLEWLALSNRHYRNEEIQYSEKILRIRAARNEFPSDLFRARYNRKVGKSKGLYRNTYTSLFNDDENELWKFGAETKTGQDRFSARDRLRNNRSLV